MLYVITHKVLEEQNKLTGVRYLFVGKSLPRFPDVYSVYDSQGDNISAKNQFYSELTGLYYLWKNHGDDVIGVCHYRRMFYKSLMPGWFDVKWSGINKNRVLNCFDQSEKDILNGKYDVVLPKPRLILTKKGLKSIKTHFVYHKSERYINLLLDEIKDVNPIFFEFYSSYIENHYSGSYWNMLIASKCVYDEICLFVFTILDGLEARIIDLDGRLESRVMGYFSESLIPAYIAFRSWRVSYRNVALIKNL